MRILLLGQNGQVGWALQRSLALLGDVIALDRHSTAWCGDLANLQGLAATVQGVRPHVIVNAAAYTQVDQAESDPILAHTINALAPAVLAEQAQTLGAWLVHYSSDYVFNGTGQQPWQEDDAPAPLNVYGQTKLASEQLIQTACQKHLILRTGWVYSARGKNFAKTMLRLAQERPHLQVVNDQWGTPTSADLLADVTAHALPHLLKNPQHRGLYHVAAKGYTTWHGYAQYLLEPTKKNGHATKNTAIEVKPVSSQTFATAAQRPLNARLCTDKLQTTFGLQLPTWQHGVDRMLGELTPHKL